MRNQQNSARRPHSYLVAPSFRTTRAGETTQNITDDSEAENTPRAREKRQGRAGRPLASEIPPRARGKDVRGDRLPVDRGNTPACAGKSPRSPLRGLPARKYPRVRGEKVVRGNAEGTGEEIPPRARGKGGGVFEEVVKVGNTPACAGKRTRLPGSLTAALKYPRVRGEKAESRRAPIALEEIPPRARGKVIESRYLVAGFGNTPACAGKSSVLEHTREVSGKYPRVRGEKSRWNQVRHGRGRIPPRARGKVPIIGSGGGFVGNTPACAGKRVYGIDWQGSGRKYPRVRGEKALERFPTPVQREIPPRARGKDH